MRSRRSWFWVAPVLVALGACHARPDDPAAVTTDEQAQLNDAAASLDAATTPVNDDDDNESDANTEDPA
ncbi:MAG: hypothetical protein ACRYFW_10540 [Janthinobacterium lividum]